MTLRHYYPRPRPGLPGEWRHDPNNPCNDHGLDPDIWADPHNTEEARQAIRLCTTCPNRQPCYDFATHPDTRQTYGIWGATLPQHR